MPRYEQLDNIRHRDLCVATGFGAHFGDNMAMVPVVPAEFRQLQREYTIFFRKDPAGGFQSVALLGFEPHENLYLQGARWVAASLPATIARGPFLIGFREHPGAAGPVREPVIHVDLAHPRVVAAGGQRVFQSDGSHSPYLEHIIAVLRAIHDGVEAGNALHAELDAMELLRPLDIDVSFDDTRGTRLSGLYGIDRERLGALDAVSLLHLHRSGLLEVVHLLLASQDNLQRLVAEKTRRLAAEG